MPENISLVRVGRFSFISPASLGSLFKDDFTFTIREVIQPSLENGFVASEKITQEKAWWDDKDAITDKSVFCFFSGFTYRVKTVLKKLGYTVVEENRRLNPMPPPDFRLIHGATFRGRQQEALLLMCSSPGGTIICPTGFGKTFLIGLFVKLFPKTKGVITAPSVTNARDIYNSLQSQVEELGFVGDKECNPQRITVATTHSLKYCDHNVAWVLVDEAHMVLSPMHLSSLLKFKSAKFLGMTATPRGKMDGRDNYLEAIFGPELIEVKYEEAVASGNVVQLEVKFLKIAQGPDVSGYSNKARKDKLGIWRNSFRNEAIAQEVRSQMAQQPNAQILIMVDKTEHAFALGQLLPEFTLVHGNTSKERLNKLAKSGAYDVDKQLPCNKQSLKKYQADFTSGRLRHAISTGIWARGVDFKDLNILVRADGLASDIHSGQIPGRLSRLGSDGKKGSGLLIDCLDMFSRDLLGRSLKRFKVCKRNKWEIQPQTVLDIRSANKLHREWCGGSDSLTRLEGYDTETSDE